MVGGVAWSSRQAMLRFETGKVWLETETFGTIVKDCTVLVQIITKMEMKCNAAVADVVAVAQNNFIFIGFIQLQVQ